MEEVVEEVETPVADNVVGEEVTPVETAGEEIETPEGEETQVEAGLSETVSREEFDTLKKTLDDSRSMVGKQSQEVGSARAKIQSLESQLSQLNRTGEQISEGIYDKPQEVIRDEIARAGLTTQLEQARQQAFSLENKNIVLASDPDFEGKIEEIAQVMQSEGVNLLDVQDFKDNPYQFESRDLLSYSKAVTQQRKLSDMEKRLHKLDPTNVAKNIEKAAHSSTNGKMTSSTGGGGDGGISVTSEMIQNATSEQRKHFIKSGEWLASP